jgi:ATP-dependent phosphoenolpyruvate carboxykinase
MPLADTAIFVAGTGMAIALYQRGSLLLHASAVAYDGRAFAFSGASGAGKSTLAALLCRDAGCEMISDDITAVTSVGQRSVPQPDGRQLRLWDDMVELLSLSEQRGPAVRSTLAKYHVQTSVARIESSLTLAGIYLLEALPSGSEPLIERVTLSESAALLEDNLYRRVLSTRFEDQATRFLRIAKLLETVPVWRLRRPVTAADNPQVIASLKEHWRSLQ